MLQSYSKRENKIEGREVEVFDVGVTANMEGKTEREWT